MQQRSKLSITLQALRTTGSTHARVNAVLDTLRDGGSYRHKGALRVKRAGPRVAALVAHMEARERRWLDTVCPAWAPYTTADGRRAAELARDVADALSSANHRAKERAMTLPECLAVLQRAADDLACGEHHDNGGTISSTSYKYRWYTTACSAQVDTDLGDVVRWGVSRISRATSPLQYRADRAICRRLATDCLPGEVAVRTSRDVWARVAIATGKRVGVQVRVGHGWEHGATLAECRAESARKVGLELERVARELVAAERAQARTPELERASRRRARAVRLLARICRAPVDLARAREAGACRAGIEAWCLARGVPLDGQVPCHVLAHDAEPWAQRIAAHVAGRAWSAAHP